MTAADLPDADRAQTRDALFDLLCCAPGDHAPALDLSADQWHWIETTAKDHRLLPLLHAIAGRDGTNEWPAFMLERCERARRSQSRRWLAQQAAMLAITDSFARAGISHVYLKGATLALSAYPEGSMRPLRDLDILVAGPRAQQAQDLLKGLGYAGLPGSAETTPLDYYQLPALRHRKSGILVELHRSLAQPELYDSGPLAQTLLETAQPHKVAGIDLPLAEPSALHCHLLLHAGIKSHFDCGPLVLADLAFLRARNAGREDGFAAAAARFGLERSDALFARLLAKHGADTHGSAVPASAPVSAPVPEGLIDHASTLLVEPSQGIRERKIVRDLRTDRPAAHKILALAKSALQPNRAKIAATTGLSVHSRWIGLGYPVWLADRALLMLRGSANRHLAKGVDADLRLGAWLRNAGE